MQDRADRNISPEHARVKHMLRYGVVLVNALGGMMYASTALASADLPVLDQVQSGEVSIQEAGKNMTINQASKKAIIEWDSFNIGQSNKVEFVQPNSKSIALNRVTGKNASTVRGRLDANGQIFLINPNGIMFTNTAKVNVGGLVATTADIKDNDFLSNQFKFEAPAKGSYVKNHGKITVKDAGLAALVAADVENKGVIRAELGKVELASGGAFTVDLYGDGKIQLALGKNSLSRIQNSGQIYAHGGQVFLSVHASQNIVNNIVNTSGIIEAHDVKNGKDGVIELVARNVQIGNRLKADDITITASNKITSSKDITAFDDIVMTAATEIDLKGNIIGNDKIDISLTKGGDLKTANITSHTGDITINNGDTSGDNHIKTGSLIAKAGKITVTAEDDLDVKGKIEAKEDVKFVSTEGDVNLSQVKSYKAQEDIIVNAKGNIVLKNARADQDVIAAAEGKITGEGNITAGRDIKFTSSKNAIDARNASFNAGDDAFLKANSDIRTKNVTAQDTVKVEATKGGDFLLANVTSKSGSVTIDNGDTSGDNMIRTGSLSAKEGSIKVTAEDDFEAQGKIESKNDTTIKSLEGDINLRKVSNYNVDEDLNLNAKGNIVLKNARADQDVIATAEGKITGEGNITAGRDIKFTSSKNAIDARNASFNAGDDAFLKANSDIRTKNVTAQDTVKVEATKGGDFLLANITSHTGDITINNGNTSGDNHIKTGSLIAKAGKIAVTAEDDFEAQGKIESKNDTTIKSLEGDINLRKVSNYNVDEDLNLNAKGNIVLKNARADQDVIATAEGKITGEGNITAGRDIKFTSSKNAIDARNASFNAGDDAFLKANSDIRTKNVTAQDTVKVEATKGGDFLLANVTSKSGSVTIDNGDTSGDNTVKVNNIKAVNGSIKVTAEDGLTLDRDAIAGKDLTLIALESDLNLTSAERLQSGNNITFDAGNKKRVILSKNTINAEKNVTFKNEAYVSGNTTIYSKVGTVNLRNGLSGNNHKTKLTVNTLENKARLPGSHEKLTVIQKTHAAPVVEVDQDPTPVTPPTPEPEVEETPVVEIPVIINQPRPEIRVTTAEERVLYDQIAQTITVNKTVPTFKSNQNPITQTVRSYNPSKGSIGSDKLITFVQPSANLDLKPQTPDTVGPTIPSAAPSSKADSKTSTNSNNPFLDNSSEEVEESSNSEE